MPYNKNINDVYYKSLYEKTLAELEKLKVEKNSMENMYEKFFKALNHQMEYNDKLYESISDERDELEEKTEFLIEENRRLKKELKELRKTA